jgi:hypothetical protein
LEVKKLYKYGFRGPDLLTACFGQAVGEFGKYENVEKADGSEVTVPELLEMAKEAAFNALVKGFDADDFTRFYIGWVQLFNFTETDFDDVNKLTKVGLSLETKDLFDENLLVKNGNKQTLATFANRISGNAKLGESLHANDIDKIHRAMSLYKGENRALLLNFISRIGASSSDSSFWRVMTALCEVLPEGIEDHKQAIGILDNRDSLIREAKSLADGKQEQGTLF